MKYTKFINTLKTIALPALVSGASANFEEVVMVTGESALANQVSAYKTGTALIDTPQSLSVVSAEQIQEQGINSVADIIDYTPGVNNSQGEGHRDAVVFRGVRSTADFFVDGVRDDVQYYRPLYNVEQVEVLRGPNALTFGRGGAGGVLNRVLKKAEIGEDFSQIQGSVDSFGATSGWFDYNATVADNQAFRLNLAYDNLANHRDFFYSNEIAINPTYTFELSDATTLTASYERLDQERFIDRGIPTGADGEPVEALSGTVFGDSELNYSTHTADILRATLSHQFNESWKANATVQYSEHDKLYANIYASDYDESTNQVELDGYEDTTQRNRFVLSADLQGLVTTGEIEHKLLFGTEFIATSNNNDRNHTSWESLSATTDRDQQWFDAGSFSLSNGSIVDANGTDSFTYSDFGDRTEATVNVFSFYAQDEIALLDNLDVIVGARFDSFDIESTSYDSTGASTEASESQSNVAPRVGLVYKLQEGLSLYATYSETFLPKSGGQFATAGADLDADKFTNLEAGVKYDMSQGLSLTAAVFNNGQDYAQLVNGEQVITEAEISGFEATLDGSLTDKWGVRAGYSYLDGETTSDVRPRELPYNTFSVWNSYQLNDKVGLGLGVIYQGETLTGNGSPSSLPSYVRVDAAAGYNFNDNQRLQLNVENLFDTDYYPSSHSTHQATVGAPINARLTFIAKF